MGTGGSRRPISFALAACNAIVLTTGLVTVAASSSVRTVTVPAGIDAVTSETASTSETSAPEAVAVDAPDATASTAGATLTPTRSAPRPTGSSPTTPAPSTPGTAAPAAAQAPQRLRPPAGAFPAVIAGTASVNGRRQAVPTTGDVVITDLDDSRQRLTLPSGPAKVELVERWSPSGSELVSLKFTADDVTKIVQLSPLESWAPLGVPVGSTLSWVARTTDGKTSVEARTRVLPAATVTIAGAAIAVDVFETVLDLGGDMSGTATIVNSVATDSRLPVRQRHVIDARATTHGFRVPIVSDVTVTLTDLDPT